jgi:urease accessory protein
MFLAAESFRPTVIDVAVEPSLCEMRGPCSARPTSGYNRRRSADSVVVAGVTAPDGHLVVLRARAARVEPALGLLESVWARWRTRLWGLAPCPPRVWST